MYFYKHKGYLYLEMFNTEIGAHLEYLSSDITECGKNDIL